jgi:hypothetical protein
MRQPPLSRTPDAVHALLSMVPGQSQEALEIAGQQTQMPVMQLGNRQRVLELLCLVL